MNDKQSRNLLDWFRNMRTGNSLNVNVTSSSSAQTVSINQTTPGTTNGVVINSGENHIGSVGGETWMETIVPVTSANAYNAGDVVGGKLTLTNAIRVAGKKGILESIHIVDTDAQSPDLTILFFTLDPTAASTADAAPFAYNNSTMRGAQIAKVNITAADWEIIDNVGSVNIGGILTTLKAFSGTSLYAVIVAGTAAPTLTAVNSLRVTIGILQD